MNGREPQQLEGCVPATPEQLDAAQITPQDIAAAREFWNFWGTPLLNAMVNGST